MALMINVQDVARIRIMATAIVTVRSRASSSSSTSRARHDGCVDRYKKRCVKKALFVRYSTFRAGVL